MQAGRKLKDLRIKVGLTVRNVTQASERIAAAKSDRRFHISIGWLAQLENGDSEPGICKLFSLSVIYQVELLELLRFYDLDLATASSFSVIAKAHTTQLLALKSSAAPPESIARIVDKTTRLLPRDNQKFASSHANGYIGLNDFTMYPLIRPGSIVRIDTKQHKLEFAKWRSEYERPIYFIELRNGYVCGWCEVNDRDLFVIPHHLSPQSIRRFVLKREAEIIGRVISFETSCIDSQTAPQFLATATG